MGARLAGARRLLIRGDSQGQIGSLREKVFDGTAQRERTAACVTEQFGEQFLTSLQHLSVAPGR